MKKHLIAAAVAAAVAVPAMAQNVTLSGYLEGSYGSIKDDGVSTSGFQGEGVFGGASNFTISGNEDLGGGLSVGFTLVQEFKIANRGYESSVTLANGTADTTQQRLTDSFAFVKGAFGEVRFGAVTYASRDLGGIYRFNGDFGRIASGFHGIGNDVNNSIQYTTPSFNGVTVAVATGKEDANGTRTAGKSNGAMLRFEQGPVRLGISQTAQTTAKAADITGGAVAKAKETIVGGSYALGTLRIGVAYAMDKPEDVACTTLATCDSTAATVQFDMPVASGVNVFGSYNAYTSKLADADGNGISLGVSQALSKRTKLFAAYNKNKNDTNATNTYRNGPSATAGQDNSRAVVGVSHSF